jgi:hypothetical protein
MHYELAYKRGSNLRQVSFTWDELIELLGPLMIGEASEGQLKVALKGKIAEWEDTHSSNIMLNDDEFQTIKVQLLALGIVKQSVKKRAPSDTATYWTLTPYGNHYTITLKAIRKPDLSE